MNALQWYVIGTWPIFLRSYDGSRTSVSGSGGLRYGTLIMTRKYIYIYNLRHALGRMLLTSQTLGPTRVRSIYLLLRSLLLRNTAVQEKNR